MPKASESKPIVGIPVDESTPEYVIGKRAEGGVGARILEFLLEHERQAFTEPMIAQALGLMREGKPHQQRVNGPMAKVWERVQEGEQPFDGFVLRLVSVEVGGKRQKAWVAWPVE